MYKEEINFINNYFQYKNITNLDIKLPETILKNINAKNTDNLKILKENDTVKYNNNNFFSKLNFKNKSKIGNNNYIYNSFLDKKLNKSTNNTIVTKKSNKSKKSEKNKYNTQNKYNKIKSKIMNSKIVNVDLDKYYKDNKLKNKQKNNINTDNILINENKLSVYYDKGNNLYNNLIGSFINIKNEWEKV